MTTVIKDLNLEHLWVVYPGKKTYRLSDQISVLSLADLDKIKNDNLTQSSNDVRYS